DTPCSEYTLKASPNALPDDPKAPNDLFTQAKPSATTYIYGPKLPFKMNIALAPPVHVGLGNPIADALFAPIIEKDLLQRALHQAIRSGYIDNQAGSPEAVL